MRKILLLLIPLICLGQKKSKGRILMIIAHENFRDEELLIPKEEFISAGYQVVIGSTDTTKAIGMLGNEIKPDIIFAHADEKNYQSLVLIGGIGARNLFADTTLHRLAQQFYKNKKPVAAICLAPIILAKSGVLSGRKATVWSGAKNDLVELGVEYVDQDVVIDSIIITGCGPKTAKLFSQKIIGILK